MQPIPVEDIINLLSSAKVGIPLELTGTVIPSNATYQNIEWELSSAGTTGAVIIGNMLYVTMEGMALVSATITNGIAIGEDYIKPFFITVSTTGIDEIYANSIFIYPNPVKEELKIESVEFKINIVEICDIAGKTLSTHTTNTINVSNLPQGVYLVKIHTDKGTTTQKIVKN